MQAVANLHFLQFAHIAIELGQSLSAAIIGRDAAIQIDAFASRQFQDAFGQGGAAAQVELAGFVIFIDQRFQFTQRPVAFSTAKRRRQMINDHRSATPLGLAALTRIVDDERIYMRQRPERGFREAGGGKRQRLARQPFEIAMLAEMDHGMGIKRTAQPGIEREIAVRRRQVGIVIAGGGINVVATRRLDRHGDIAKREYREDEGTLLGEKERIGFHCTPTLGNTHPSSAVQIREKILIVVRAELGTARWFGVSR